MEDKVCLTTYVYGSKYQDYIPLLIYSIGKAYPQYTVLIFIYETLRANVVVQLDIVRQFYTNFEIIENTFSDCPRMDSLKSKCLRWVLWNDLFNEYDYIYIVDIDILYSPERIPLHEQHKIHMKFIGSECVSNIRRLLHPSFLGGLQVLKHYGVIPFLNYWKCHGEYRTSGLHFFERKNYYKHVSETLRQKYKESIYKSKIYTHARLMNNEIFLTSLLEDADIRTDIFSIQSSSIAQLDPNNPCRGEFRPHHGIHLGIFREQLDQMSESTKQILNSDIYQDYIKYYCGNIKNDPVFVQLSLHFNDRLKKYFYSLEKYYSIEN